MPKAPDQLVMFHGFRWAVREAFQSALAECRFERGDLFYESAEAYREPWVPAGESGIGHVQVRSSAGVAATEAESDADGDAGPEADSDADGDATTKAVKDTDGVFERNWSLPLVVDLVLPRVPARLGVETTQGRLYTMLWKGDPGVLDSKVPPASPVKTKELLKQMVTEADLVRQRMGVALGSVLFLMPFDSARDRHREKRALVTWVLKSRFRLAVDDVHPTELGLVPIGDIRPTFAITRFVVPNGTREDVEQAIKSVLYAPTADAEQTKRKFRITAHGLLLGE